MPSGRKTSCPHNWFSFHTLYLVLNGKDDVTTAAFSHAIRQIDIIRHYSLFTRWAVHFLKYLGKILLNPLSIPASQQACIALLHAP